jgi:hypothetical protein
VDRTCQWFRFTPTKFRSAGKNSVQLGEFRFVDKGTPLNLAGVTVSNPGGNTPLAEGPANVRDNHHGTKWLDFNQQPARPERQRRHRQGMRGPGGIRVR